MAHGIATIHVRVQRKGLVVQAQGRTDRGQKYIKEEIALEAKSPADPNFKTELAAAVEKLYD